MLIHILTFGNFERSSEVTKKDIGLLIEAGKKLKHKIEVISSADCQLTFSKQGPGILIKGKTPQELGIKKLLVRANFLGTNVEFRTAVIKQFQIAGVLVVNNHLAVLRAKNKLRTMQSLGRYKVPMPKTFMISSKEYIDDGVKYIGKFPMILKTVTGSHGSGVSIVESKRGLRSVAELIMRNEGPEPLMLQEYVKESKGKDVRVFIVGKRILAAMERIAQKKGEFRSNFHLGGRVKVAEMSRKEKDVAFSAVKALGLEMAGVDILRTNEGPKVLEVNANPGLEGITLASGRDIAGEIIKYTVKFKKKNN